MNININHYYGYFMNRQSKIVKIFGNSMIKINKNHDEAINTFKNYIAESKDKINVLVNYDTHSDIFVNGKLSEITIGNWANFCFNKLGISDYYWIVPKYITENEHFKKIYEQKQELRINYPLRSFDDADINLDNINTREFFFDIDTSELISSSKFEYINNKCKRYGITQLIEESKRFQKVKIFIISLKNICQLKGKQVFLSVDADAFCNTGFDTTFGINNKEITHEQLEDEFDYFIDCLYNCNIDIKCASLVRSPVYFPKLFEQDLNNFYKEIYDSSIYN